MNWEGWDFVPGTWESEGGGQPGRASAGGFSFAPDLGGRILVRRSFTEFPPSGSRPGFRHDDLMVVERDGTGATRATYGDNEGHRIDYDVSLTERPRTITFQARAPTTAERARFVYWERGSGSLEFTFDLAPPGSPTFTTHVRGTAHRVNL